MHVIFVKDMSLALVPSVSCAEASPLALTTLAEGLESVNGRRDRGHDLLVPAEGTII